MKNLEDVLIEVEDIMNELDDENPHKERLRDCYDTLENIRYALDNTRGEIDKQVAVLAMLTPYER